MSKRPFRLAVRLLSTVAILLVLVAGCGIASGSRPGPGSVLSQRSADATGSRVGSVPHVVGGPLPLLAALQPGEIVIPWQLNRADTLTSKVYLSVTGLGCSVPKALSVKEQLDKITITAYGTGPVEPCTGRSVTLYGYVMTAAPIAGRRVIHGG